jgi:hypothetical protein
MGYESYEHSLRQLVEAIRSAGHPNPQLRLKELEVEEVDDEFRPAFSFWKSLSGKSRGLMFDNACGRRMNKRW